MSVKSTGVRALFLVSHVTKDSYGGTKIELSATQGKKWPEDKESQDFADATPSGNLSFYINPGRPAADFFVPGDEVYLDFTKREHKAAE